MELDWLILRPFNLEMRTGRRREGFFDECRPTSMGLPSPLLLDTVFDAGVCL